MGRDAITKTRPNCAHVLDFGNKVFNEDCRLTMSRVPVDSVPLVITSPPYFGCRVYGGETLGNEQHPGDYIAHVVAVTEMVRRVLAPNGSFYLNVADLFSRHEGLFAQHREAPEEDGPPLPRA